MAEQRGLERRTVAILAGSGLVTALAALLLPAGSTAGVDSPSPIQAAAVTQAPVREEAPRIDVVFVLDTTGSMGGLIEGAKMKIWSVANDIMSGQPKPVVRIGLVGYRDRSDAYIVRQTPLSGDIDAVYEQLQALRADGGGDTPEDVNAGLKAALDMPWSQDSKVLRLVFLVGDAPPHDDYAGPKSHELAALARERGIIINTIRAGGMPTTEVAWQRIAAAGGGQFTSIAQDGGMMAVATPYDDDLRTLNEGLADTSIAYGAAPARRRLRSKVMRRKAMAPEAAASAASYSGKAGGGLGRGDLLADLDSGRASVRKLDKNKLSGTLAAMDESTRTKYIEKKRAKRRQLSKKIAEISKKRDAFLRSKKKEAPTDSFDRNVMDMLGEQAADIGVSFD